MKTLSTAYKPLIKVLTVLLISSSAIASEDSLSIVLDGKTVLKVDKNKPKVIQKAINLGTEYIADLQETINFNTNVRTGFGVHISNNRKLFPLGNGDIIVADSTGIGADYATSAMRKSLEKLDLSFNVTGRAKPTVKRFFISSATDNRQDYYDTKGPRGVDVKFGVDTKLYGIGAGVKLDKTRYARYNKWITERFTKNIIDFPLDAKKADSMIVGEGYSFAFEGALSLGPSAYFLSNFSEFSIGLDFKFNKIIRSGRFEIIVYKHSKGKVLFSLRQARNVLNKEDFSLSYGASLNANLDLLIGSPSSLFSLPTGFKIFTASRTRSLKNENRFNAVYEIDLANSGTRALYDDALSKFDFSLFDVFTLADLSRSSKILKKFRGENLKLVLETNEKVRVHGRSFDTKTLRAYRTSRTHEKEWAEGRSRFSNRTVQTARGKAMTSYVQRSFFRGNENSSFEITAYEEHGAEAKASSDDIVMLATGVLLDEDTSGNELRNYVREFNYFLPETNQIPEINYKSNNFETTQGRVEFLITREQVNRFKDLNKEDVRWLILTHYKNFIKSDLRRQELYKSKPSTWTFTFLERRLYGRELFAMKNFAVGFFSLQTYLKGRDIKGAARALNQMIQDGAQSQSYALLLKRLVIQTGSKPITNVRFYNSRTKVNFLSKDTVNKKDFSRDGLILSQRVEKVLSGIGYYDNLASSYYSPPTVNSQGVVNFVFKRRFDGFIKLSLRKKLKGNSSFISVGEFIIDLTKLAPVKMSFDLLNGKSGAEREASRILARLGDDIEIYFSLSYDDISYDVDRVVGEEEETFSY